METLLDLYTEPVYIPLEIETRYELVPAPFYCTSGCGGNAIDPANINLFDHGECIRHGVCK